jgi:hypothetical protein
MAVITSGKTFANGEQLSASKLNQVITAATFNASDAVDGSTMTLVGGAMAVRDDGIVTAKILNGNVTKAKIENVANMKVLGNTSGSATAPQEVAILDEDNMSTDSATSLATQQSIKAYVDASSTDGFTPTATASDTKSVTLPNGLIMKFGRVVAGGGTTTTINFSDFGGNFTNDIFSVVLTAERSGGETNQARLNAAPTTSSFVINNDLSGNTNVDFIAIGR